MTQSTDTSRDQAASGNQGQGGERQSGSRGSSNAKNRNPKAKDPGSTPTGDPRAQQSRSSRRRGRRRRSRKSSGGQASAERVVVGYLEIAKNGVGYVRPDALAGRDDAKIPAHMIRGLGLRVGDLVEATARGDTVQSVAKVNGGHPDELRGRVRFADLTAVHPDAALVLGPSPRAITGRLLDLIAPVGRGQRGLIVAPPKAGKTTILKDIAIGLGTNPSLTIITCLVAERPEEVTDLRRAIPGTVLAADLDMPSEDHIRVANLGVEHAKRLVESGRDVVVLLDSLTRLARAHNLALRGSSRTMSGGMDAAALYPVRQVFGAARAAEEGGSLTMIATCLVDTGSKMDDLVYEEFKGTGNMEVHLDRSLAEKRLFPAVDIARSGTRREELLLAPQTLQQVSALRRKLAGVPSDQALSALLDALKRGRAAEA